MNISMISLLWEYVIVFTIFLHCIFLDHVPTTVEPHHYGHPLGKSDLNGEVTVLQGVNLHEGIQFRTEQR